MFPCSFRHTSALDRSAGECAVCGGAELCLRGALQAQRTACADRIHLVVVSENTIGCIGSRYSLEEVVRPSLSPALSWHLRGVSTLADTSHTAAIPLGRDEHLTNPLNHNVVILTFGAASGLPQASSATMPRRASTPADSHLRRRRGQRGAIPFSADSLPSAFQGFPDESGH